MKHSLYLLTTAMLLLSACHKAEIPAMYTTVEEPVRLLPDYADVTIPPNIAPLNFLIDEEGIEACVAQINYPGGTLTVGKGNHIVFEEEQWRTILKSTIGKSLVVDLYAKKKEAWQRYPSFEIRVAPDSLDAYVSYRLIPPSYSTYEDLFICQRCIENFEEVQLYNNRMLGSVKGGHCINCHAFQNYHTERMQFHVRSEYGGTIIYDQGKLSKVDLKRNGAISSGVYPAWHPTRNLIVYSMNMTSQNFHTHYKGKVEVFDSAAGLLLYDVENDEVQVICNEPDLLDAFPTWSPDGEWLYYASARHKEMTEYEQLKYNIMRRRFDAEHLSFGAAEMVLDAAAMGMSATVPRISPDGNYLLFTLGNYGVFHIWHPEADLYIADLQQDSISCHPLTAANSSRAESYHNWSSNGRWMVFESRRRDNNYTRLYFAYFDRNGEVHKAFELPQEDPNYETLHLRSYNVPELTIEPVKTTPQTLAEKVQSL